jgi:hypothetical protein
MIDFLVVAGVCLFFLLQLDQVSLRNQIILTNYLIVWTIFLLGYLVSSFLLHF